MFSILQSGDRILLYWVADMESKRDRESDQPADNGAATVSLLGKGVCSVFT